MMEFFLDEKEKMILLATARESIGAHFDGKEGKYPKPTKKISTPLGAFVTLHTNGMLRGCIGHIIPVRPLIEDIRILAIESAFHDPRFPGLTDREFKKTDIEISVLSPLKNSSPEDVIVGKHGIIMKNGYNSGVLLPQVPVEQGWDREEFLNQTCYKSGLHRNCWKDKNTLIQTFTAVVFGELTNS
ncbi:MAG: AmmeMemoRadiSam system protein A [Spirochaetales bacterium]|nr:AmmeMemoRadiSam system protein A [Spirochaetales bacterium]